MKSTFPRPLVNVAKFFIIPILRFRWKRHPIVNEWVKQGLISDREINWLVLNWQKHGKPIPPPPKIKQQIVTSFSKTYQCENLVETGTYKGDMIFAQLNHFKKLFSIELSIPFWEEAKKRFLDRKEVTLIQGDSGVELPKLVNALDAMTLFWLDGHYCGGETAQSEVECPIYAELNCIFQHSLKHVILIDDARMFNGTRDYPTIDELNDFVSKNGKNYILKMENDIIAILPV